MITPNRDQPHCFNMYACEPRRLDGPRALGGLMGVILSYDDRSRAITALVHLPARWTVASDVEADLEVFVLKGELTLEGETVRCGGYVHVPHGCESAELSSSLGAIAVAFWTPGAVSFPPPYTHLRAVRAHELPWTPAAPGAHGLLCKMLRAPDVTTETFDGGPGGFIRLFMLAPGTRDHQQHVHLECWEEVITLSGDVFMADEGLTARGTALGHPRGFFHGPFASHSGAVLLVHTECPHGPTVAAPRLPLRRRGNRDISRSRVVVRASGAHRLGRTARA